MRTEELIAAVSEQSKENEKLEAIRRGLPLGKSFGGEILLSQKRGKPLTVRNTCVTGIWRTTFIRRLLVTLSCLYEKTEACFFVLSPRTEYGELLRLRAADVTVPYVTDGVQLSAALDTLKELLEMRRTGGGYPHIFLVLDGLETLDDDANGDLAVYRNIYDLLMRRTDIDVITGVELARSIFADYPGAFVGVGNCLVSTREDGKADVTYVNDDSSLTLPVSVVYPSEPSVMESIIFLNALPAADVNGENNA